MNWEQCQSIGLQSTELPNTALNIKCQKQKHVMDICIFCLHFFKLYIQFYVLFRDFYFSLFHFYFVLLCTSQTDRRINAQNHRRHKSIVICLLYPWTGRSINNKSYSYFTYKLINKRASSRIFFSVMPKGARYFNYIKQNLPLKNDNVRLFSPILLRRYLELSLLINWELLCF